MGNVKVLKKKGENKWNFFDLPPKIVTEEDRLQSLSPFTIGGCRFFLLFAINSQPKCCDRNLMHQTNKLWYSQWMKPFLKSEKLMRNFKQPIDSASLCYHLNGLKYDVKLNISRNSMWFLVASNILSLILVAGYTSNTKKFGKGLWPHLKFISFVLKNEAKDKIIKIFLITIIKSAFVWSETD